MASGESRVKAFIFILARFFETHRATSTSEVYTGRIVSTDIMLSIAASYLC